MLQIFSGLYKNKRLPTRPDLRYKPVTSKLRSAVFSILSSGEFALHPAYQNAIVLDLFCGTGIYAFEALSRGAQSITLIDIDGAALKRIEEFALFLGASNNVTCIKADIKALPKVGRKISKVYSQYDLVFIDPPYHNSLIPPTVSTLLNWDWLKPHAVLVLEMSKSEEYEIPPDFRLITKRIYGKSMLIIMRYLQ